MKHWANLWDVTSGGLKCTWQLLWRQRFCTLLSVGRVNFKWKQLLLGPREVPGKFSWELPICLQVLMWKDRLSKGTEKWEGKEKKESSCWYDIGLWSDKKLVTAYTKMMCVISFPLHLFSGFVPSTSCRPPAGRKERSSLELEGMKAVNTERYIPEFCNPICGTSINSTTLWTKWELNTKSSINENNTLKWEKIH